jgi:uncharacterized phiE125 gp8 family phage protein
MPWRPDHPSDPYREPRQPTFRPTLLGPLSLAVAPTGVAVTTAEAKLWCRVDHSAEDSLIAALVARATAFCEGEVSGQRQVLRATWDAPVLGWWDAPLRLPRPPLVSVTSVTYYDAAGAQQTLSGSAYEVRTPWRQPGEVERAPDATWPALQCDRTYPVTVRFVAGWGEGNVPAVVQQAILLLVAWWYDHRGAEVAPEVMRAVRDLLAVEGWGSYA